MVQNKEIRKIVVESVETRSTENGEKVIEGYIAKFMVRSQFMGFFEQIAPNAFEKTLANGHNVFAMYNHNDDKILGSTKTGSLALSVDNVGLRFSLTINPNVSYANDTYELVKSGDVDGCSFGFICIDDDWQKLSDSTDLRTLLGVELIEVTITPFPAYVQSEAEARCKSFENHKALEQRQEKLNLLKQKLLIEVDM